MERIHTAPSSRDGQSTRLLHFLAVGFELTCVAAIIVLLGVAWEFEDAQSLVIPFILGLVICTSSKSFGLEMLLAKRRFGTSS